MRPAMSSVSARATIASFCASSGGGASSPANAARAKAVPARAARDACVTRLRSDAIERAALIVRDEHGAVLVDLDVRGSSPPRTIGTLPPRDEILDPGRHAASPANAHDLRAGGLRAVPRAV